MAILVLVASIVQEKEDTCACDLLYECCCVLTLLQLVRVPNILPFILCQKSVSTFDTKKIVKCSWASHWVMGLLTFDFCDTLDPIR